jgi:hypothetical protein
VSAIQQNGWKVVGSEHPIEGELDGQRLKGIADLVLTRDNGSTHAVVDFKWSGKHYLDRLRNEEDLQLTLYARLLDSEGAWAHTAYFIIDRGVFYARNKQAFQEAQTPGVPKDHVDAYERIWEKMLKTLRWRREQLAQGRVEVRCEATFNALEEHYGNALLDLLELPRNDAKYDDFTVLIGL